MKQLTTTAIVLTRSDFGEADRILTVLTPDSGKLRLMAKGVRRIKSKLAGGIELFSISHITYIPGRGEIGTLVSTRLISHFGTIVKDIDRTMLGYDLLKRLNRATEDQPEADYFNLLEAGFMALDDAAVPSALIDIWFNAQLLKQAGHTPNLTHTQDGARVSADSAYDYDIDNSVLMVRPDGSLKVDEIKFLRLIFSENELPLLARVAGAEQLSTRLQRLVMTMFREYIRN